MTPQNSARHRAIIRAAWSLGLATSTTLRALVAPEITLQAFRRQLRTLTRSGHLITLTFPGGAGHLWLYGATRRGLDADGPKPWRPSLAQLQHTLDVGEAVVALTRPGFAEPLTVTDWQGEAEVRRWARPGQPFPDARVAWRHAAGNGIWLVEVDRATESRGPWRRKLVRYLQQPAAGHLFVITTTWRRAGNLAALADEAGVRAFVTTMASVRTDVRPDVLDSRNRTRATLPAAVLTAADAAPSHGRGTPLARRERP